MLYPWAPWALTKRPTILLTVRPTLVQEVLGENHTLERFAEQIELHVEHVARTIRLHRKQFVRRRPTCPTAVKHQLEQQKQWPMHRRLARWTRFRMRHSG